MSYTMTYDSGHKVRRGRHQQAFFRHIARDADRAAGFEFNHLNKNIDHDRTHLNTTMVNNGHGGYRALKSLGEEEPPSNEFDNYLQTRLATVRHTIRKDAVPIRGIILQLDPIWHEDHDPNWQSNGLSDEARRLLHTALDWFSDQVGQKNIIGWSIHLDEVNPQMQVMMTPVTDDGRLSQALFFQSPKALKQQHVELRKVMAAAGYDVDLSVTTRSTEHLSSSEFQWMADKLRKGTKELAEGRAEIERSRRRNSQRALELAVREDAAQDKERELKAQTEETRRQQRAAQDATDRANRAHDRTVRAQREAEDDREKLIAINKKLEAMPKDVDRWLDKAKMPNGKPLRAMFDADAKKMSESRRHAVASVLGEWPTNDRARDDQPQL